MSTSPTGTSRQGRADLVSGVVVALAGAGLFLAARGIDGPSGPSIGIGPGTMPTVLAVGLVVAGLVLAVGGARRTRAPAPGPTDDEAGAGEQVARLADDADPPVPWRRLAVMVALLVGYALVFIPLGYLISTALYLAAAVSLVDPQRWRRNLLFAVVFAVVVFYSFTQLLAVELPPGPFILPGV